jgi:hypothetical protein
MKFNGKIVKDTTMYFTLDIDDSLLILNELKSHENNFRIKISSEILVDNNVKWLLSISDGVALLKEVLIKE